MRWMMVATALTIATITAPVSAKDANGFRAIAAGDMTLAERELVAQRRDFPARPELMLNLAHVYASTARPEQARALYQDVLARRSVAMDLPDGSVITSHALAQLGLNRLSAKSVASR